MDLYKKIEAYYTKGIPPHELTDNIREQRRLRDLFNLFEMYRQNPCINLTHCLLHKFHHGLRLIPEDLAYFEYIRTTFAPISRRQKQDIVNFAVESALQDAIQVGDRGDMLKAASLIIKVNQLDKPQQEESVVKNTATLPIFLVASPKTVTQDAIEYTDDELERQIKLFGAHQNQYKQRIAEKRREMDDAAIAIPLPETEPETDTTCQE